MEIICKYSRNLSIHGFWYMPRGPETNSLWILKDNCVKKTCGTCDAPVYTRKDSVTIKKFEPIGRLHSWLLLVDFLKGEVVMETQPVLRHMLVFYIFVLSPFLNRSSSQATFLRPREQA